MAQTVVSSDQISSMNISGYKSIAECKIELGMLNVLIGSNGAGKSNFIGFFKFVKKMLDQQLQIQVTVAGGPDAVLHFGRKNTPSLCAELYFGNNGYKFSLSGTNDNKLVFGLVTLLFRCGEFFVRPPLLRKPVG